MSTSATVGPAEGHLARIRLPRAFTWGVATAAYQIEGAVAQGGRTPSIWDTFSHTPGRVARGESGDVACDHYHRLAEDVAIMRDLGVGGYRFSIAWPRLVPEGVGEVNPRGVRFYRRLCEQLLDAGIRPLATLYHWDLPQVLQDRGGWAWPGIVDAFAGYATAAVAALGDLVADWMTLNEPYCAAFLGHGSGIHAPGLAEPATAHLAAHHMVLAHHRAAAAMRRTATRADTRIGVALNLIPARPVDPDGPDADAADAVDAIQNRLFLQGVTAGTYPAEVQAHHRRFGIADVVDLAALEAAAEPLDLLGVNYYNVTHVAHEEGAPAPASYPGADGVVAVEPPGPLTAMGWGVEPDGLAWMLRRVAAEHPSLPLVITENGAAYPDVVADDGSVEDPERIAYLAAHLAVVADAVADGIDVQGYYLWSLLDNFEWALGYDMRFGIVRVDPTTLDRTPKASARWYAALISGQRD